MTPTGQTERFHRVPRRAFAAAALGFIVGLAMLRFNQPLLFQRHPDRAVLQCLLLAGTFFLMSVIAHQLKNRDTES